MSEGTIRLMAHLVAGFPSREASLETAYGLLDAGVDYLEVQFPYSDPSADGPAIQAACSESLRRGFRVDDGFRIVREIIEEIRRRVARGRAPAVPVFVMSYAGVVFARGIERFASDAGSAGATGLIVPDLCPGSDEGLYEVGRANGLAVVPVVAPGASPERLGAILAIESPFLYAAIRTGITGAKSLVDESVGRFLDTLRRPGRTLIAGFGITDHEQARLLAKHADVLVVGSAFVRAVEHATATGEDVRASIKRRAAEIVGRR
jgi:tryptophan synthase alpha chain